MSKVDINEEEVELSGVPAEIVLNLGLEGMIGRVKFEDLKGITWSKEFVDKFHNKVTKLDKNTSENDKLTKAHL